VSGLEAFLCQTIFETRSVNELGGSVGIMTLVGYKSASVMPTEGLEIKLLQTRNLVRSLKDESAGLRLPHSENDPINWNDIFEFYLIMILLSVRTAYGSGRASRRRREIQ